ncbi:spore coat protein U domain-containing protein [Pseudomonas sp.]|uniref:spore coat protein U domain-containing protein n=1 Tax=Pseudomonas sp. TaxID=306 RepID=UPI003CC5A5EB
MRPLLLLILLPLSPAALAYRCSVASTPLLFGQVAGVADRVQSSTASVTVTCEAGASAASVGYSLYMDSADSTEHALRNGSGTAQYHLFMANGRQPILHGQAFAGDRYTLAAYTSATRTYTVYARMQAGQAGTPGTYQAMNAIRLLY